jgi:predicted acetyltransferase
MSAEGPAARPAVPPAVEVRLADAADRVLIRNLYPLYLHDLSAYTGFYDVDERGVFFPDYLPDWLDRRSPVQHPLVIRAAGRPAGFALVAQAPYPHMGPGRDVRMCEFFVLHRWRRQGVGRRAARAVFAMFPGVWEVTELPGNAAATSFWRAVIGEHTGGAFTEGIELGEVVQVFTSGRGADGRAR